LVIPSSSSSIMWCTVSHSSAFTSPPAPVAAPACKMQNGHLLCTWRWRTRERIHTAAPALLQLDTLGTYYATTSSRITPRLCEPTAKKKWFDVDMLVTAGSPAWGPLDTNMHLLATGHQCCTSVSLILTSEHLSVPCRQSVCAV
jgi:hypothetical protein